MLPQCLQAVVQYDSGGKIVFTGARSDQPKWYLFLPDGSVAEAEGQPHRILAQFPPGTIIVLGTWTDDEGYARIMEEAYASHW